MSSRRSKFVALGFSLLVPGCLTAIDHDGETSGPPAGARARTGGRAAAAAQALIGAPRLKVGDRHFNMDCTGVVLAAYYAAGFDLWALIAPLPGGGTARLFRVMEERGLLHEVTPAIGDLIFWDDTYDRNGDGIWNDPLTHVAIVVAVAAGGDVAFVHHDYRRGVVRAAMNLKEPGAPSLNSPMRMRGTFGPGDPVLAGELFRAFGSAWRLVP